MRLLCIIITTCLFHSICFGQENTQRKAIEEAVLQYKELDNDPQLLLLEGSLQKCIDAFGKNDTTTLKVYIEIGDWYLRNRGFEKALEYAKNQVEIATQLQMVDFELPSAYTRLANCYKWLYNFEKSKDFYLKSIKLNNSRFKQLDFKNYIGLSTVLYAQGNYNLLIDHSHKAFQLAQTPAEKCDAYYYSFQGYARLRNKEACKELADKSIKLAKKNNLNFHLGRAYTNLAWLRILNKEYVQALGYYDKGVNFINKSNYESKHRNLAYSYSTMAHIYKILQEPEMSIGYAKKAIDENKAFYNSTYHPDLARMYHNLAAKYMWQKDYEAGLRHEQKAIISYLNDESFTDSRKVIPKSKLYPVSIKRELLISLTDKALCYALLYLEHKNREDLISAEKHISNAVELIDIMRSELSTENTKIYWRSRTRKIYNTAVELAEWLEDKEKMLKYMEKSRSLLLMDELNHQDALGMLPDRLRNREKLMREAFIDSDEKDVVKFQVYNSFLDSLKEAYPAYYKYKFDIITPSISEIQNDFLNDSTNVIQYYMTSDSLYILNITNKNVELETRPSSKTLKSDIKSLLSILSNKDSLEFKSHFEEFQELSFGIYQKLFGCLTHHRKHTIVIGDGIINYVPFDVLIREKGMVPKYLIEDHVFSTAPSLSVLKVNQKNSTNKFDNMLMVCPEYFSFNELAPLIQSENEITAFQDITTTQVLRREEASLNNFNAQCSDYDIIHFSSHSGVNQETNQPWIAFNDSLINLNEIYKLDLNASLVILSSCRSLDGKSNTSEGINSMARAFLFANSSAVVGSMWDLNEAAGFEILNDFYKGLKKNMDKPSSLREAKLKYIKKNPYKSAYYWAPLIMIGDPDGLDTTPSQSHLGWMLIIVVALGLMFFVFRWQRLFQNTKS